MKGKYTLRILEVIGDITVNTLDVLQVIVEHPNKTALITQSRKNLDAILEKRQKSRKLREEYLLRVRRYQNLIAWLKRDGLIKEIILKKKKFFRVTQKGKKYRETLLKRASGALPIPRYKKRKGKKIIIVAFDIPEKENQKRTWLRQALKNIDFQMIQKSVWIGNARIPIELLHDLQHLNLLEFIEMFAVTQKGSLRNLKKKNTHKNKPA